MMKNFIIIISLIFAVFPVYTNADNFPEDIARIKSKGEIVVAVYYKDIFPFFFKNKQGKLAGYDINLAKSIATKLGVRVKFNREAKTFNQLIDLVNEKKVDIAISLISITFDRAKKVFFSNPYLILHPVLVLNRVKSSHYKLKIGKKLPDIVTIKKGTSYVEFVKNIFPHSRVKEVDTWDKAVTNVYNGYYFGFLRDEVGVNNMLRKNPSISIKLKTIVLKNFKDNIAIAINSHDRHLHYWINLFLQTEPPEHNIDKILNFYKGSFFEHK